MKQVFCSLVNMDTEVVTRKGEEAVNPTFERRPVSENIVLRSSTEHSRFALLPYSFPIAVGASHCGV